MPVKPSPSEKLGPVISSRGRAISYQRVSSAGQATEDKSSFERQQEVFDAWCAAHPDYQPLDTYRVTRSGADTGRFDWLFTGIKQGDFIPGDVLVVESLNRFGREAMADTLENLFDIWKTGIKTAFCDHKEGQVFDKQDFNSDSSTIFLLAGKITAARDLHLDRKKWSQGSVTKNHKAIYDGRLNDSYFKPREQGKRALYPFWLDYYREDNNGKGGFRTNDEVRWIKRMFQLALKDGQYVIAQKLNEEGFTTNKGKPVDGSTVGNYLRDVKTMGWWFPTSQVKDEKTGNRRNIQVGPIKRDVFAPAITEKLFNAVKQKFEERHNNEGSPNTGGGKMLNLFAGASFCIHCGGLARRIAQANGYEPKVRCSVSKRDIKTCSQRRGVTYNEPKLIRMLERFRWDEYFRDERKGEQVAQITAEQSKAQAVLNAAAQEVDNLTAMQRDFKKQKRAWPEWVDEDMAKAKESFKDAQTALDKLSAQLTDRTRQKSGKEAAEAIQQKLRDFIVNQDDLNTRKEFNDWFISTGLVFIYDFELDDIQLVTGRIVSEGRQRSLDLRSVEHSEPLLRALAQTEGVGSDFFTSRYRDWLHFIAHDETGEKPPMLVLLETGFVVWWGNREDQLYLPARYGENDPLPKRFWFEGKVRSSDEFNEAPPSPSDP